VQRQRATFATNIARLQQTQPHTHQTHGVIFIVIDIDIDL
jgi:hypothetical protein